MELCHRRNRACFLVMQRQLQNVAVSEVAHLDLRDTEVKVGKDILAIFQRLMAQQGRRN